MASTNNETCMICTEKINKVRHKLVTCCYCEFSACRKCCETYILDKLQPQCMNTSCNKEWSLKFMVDNFTRQFLNTEWKKHKENILFDKENALLPATQPFLEERIEKRNILGEMSKIEREIWALTKKRNKLREDLEKLNRGERAVRERHFIRACPVSDCRGFLSSQWKCGLCENWTCPDCHIVLGRDKKVEHTCNPDDLATAELLSKDTKPCPKCSTGIFKIEGCDQMWCTQCHTAFSWRTGRIETRIHNPHYFEFMRRSQGDAPRNPQDNYVCGRDVTDYVVKRDIRHLVRKVFRMAKEELLLFYIMQSMTHLIEVQLPTYRVDEQENNLELRIQYLDKKIDKDKFQALIQQANKRHNKKREIYEILGLFQRTVTEIFLRLLNALEQEVPNVHLNNNKGPELVHAYIGEIEGIRKYTNQCLAEISTKYHSIGKEIIFYDDCNGRMVYKKKANSNEQVRAFNRDVLCTIEKVPTKKMVDKMVTEAATAVEIIVIE